MIHSGNDDGLVMMLLY